MPDSLFIAFWKVENFFDVESADRSENLRGILGKDLSGWDDVVPESKLRQLSRVIMHHEFRGVPRYPRGVRG